MQNWDMLGRGYVRNHQWRGLFGMSAMDFWHRSRCDRVSVFHGMRNQTIQRLFIVAVAMRNHARCGGAMFMSMSNRVDSRGRGTDRKLVLLCSRSTGCCRESVVRGRTLFTF